MRKTMSVFLVRRKGIGEKQRFVHLVRDWGVSIVKMG